MSEAHRKTRELLARSDVTVAMSPADRERTANIIMEHRELRHALRELIQFQDGFTHEHETLVRMVFALLGTVTASSNGQANWMTEIPPGTAPAFRRALNELTNYLRDSSRR